MCKCAQGNVSLTSAAPASSTETWAAISANKACEANAEGIRRTKYVTGVDLATCKATCVKTARCQAIDFYRRSGWCNLFSRACTTPRAAHDGASSYKLDVSVPGIDMDVFEGGGWTFVNEAGRSTTDVDDLSTIAVHSYKLPVYVIKQPFQEVLVQRVTPTWCDSWGGTSKTHW